MGSHVIHVEVVGRDGPALQEPDSSVFGWQLNTDNPGGYGMIDAAGEGIRRRERRLARGHPAAETAPRAIASGGGNGASRDGGPGHVTFYLHADDAGATLRRVEELGGA